MSENKFTPGPWEALLVANYWIESEKGSICNIDSSSINAEANANLIAAAPELLEACEEFVRKVECGAARSTQSYEQMKKAIAKAKGE